LFKSLTYSLFLVSSTLLHIDDTMYYIENTKPRHWYGARSACQSMGYNLVSFSTTNKYNALQRYLDDQRDTDHYWTSGNDFMTPGRHVWFPSGKPVASYLWYPGQPNNSTGLEHCDKIYKSKMYAQDCTLKHCYICERLLK
ncbi:hypothetical protein KR038_006427, partial [Drosophila bunnanda]